MGGTQEGEKARRTQGRGRSVPRPIRSTFPLTHPLTHLPTYLAQQSAVSRVASPRHRAPPNPWKPRSGRGGASRVGPDYRPQLGPRRAAVPLRACFLVCEMPYRVAVRDCDGAWHVGGTTHDRHYPHRPRSGEEKSQSRSGPLGHYLGCQGRSEITQPTK